MHLGRRRRPVARVSNPARSRRNALTAGGSRVSPRRDGGQLRRLVQPWQVRALDYYDEVGEIKFAAQFYARMLAPLRLYAGKLDEQGELLELDVKSKNKDDQTAIDTLRRVQDPGGGRTGLQSQYGRLMFLIGDAYLVCTQDEDDLEQWEVLSPKELRINSSDTYSRFRAPGLTPEELRDPPDDQFEPLAGQAVVYRLWQKHPAQSELADATMQGVLDTCEEIQMLTRRIRSSIRSRLAGNGILLVSEKVTIVPQEPEPDDDPMVDPLISEMTYAFTASIADEGAASAVVPLVLRIPEDVKVSEVIEFIRINDPTQLYPETGLRREAIDRLAIDLDMPPEALTGVGSMNHWGGWVVQEETWRTHGQPVAQGFCNDLTSSFYRPTLKAAGVKDWRLYAIGYDAAAVVNHPDRTKDAKDLYGQGAIGLAALREVAGFDDDDAPTEQDRAERIGILTRDSSLAWFGIPSIKAGGIEPEAGVVEKAGETTSGVPQSSTGAEVEKGPPPGNPAEAPQQGVVGSSNGHFAAYVLGGCELGAQRAREVAGNRALSLARKDRGLELGRVAPGAACALIGEEKLRGLGAPSEGELVAGAAPFVATALRSWRLTEEQAALVAEKVVQHAARHLYEEQPPPLPQSFEGWLRGLLSQPL